MAGGLRGMMREWRRAGSEDGAPPEGVRVSEQVVENGIWRLQINLASGGVCSLHLRQDGIRELADANALILPFQFIRAAAAGVALEASRFSGARARFDTRGASLEVASSLSGLTGRVLFRVNAGDPQLDVEARWEGPGAREGLALVLPPAGAAGWTSGPADRLRMEGRDFQVTAAGEGLRGIPGRAAADLSGISGGLLRFRLRGGAPRAGG